MLLLYLLMECISFHYMDLKEKILFRQIELICLNFYASILYYFEVFLIS